MPDQFLHGGVDGGVERGRLAGLPGDFRAAREFGENVLGVHVW